MKSPGEAAAVPLTGAITNGTFCPQAQRRFVLIAAILASALGFIDGSILAIAMPALRADLGASLAEVQWISNAYALTLSALILAGGRRRRPIRPEARFRGGHRPVHSRLARLRAFAQRRRAGRVPCHPGHRRRHHAA